MVEQLNIILDMIKYKQTISESKNTLLFAVDSGIIIAVITLISTNSMPKIFIFTSYALIIAMVISIILVLLSMWSFNTDLSFKSGYKSEANSIMHYENLINYTPDELLSTLAPTTNTFSILEKSLAQEIIINAKVTCRKFKIFAFNVKLVIISIFTIFILYLYQVIMNIIAA